MQEEIRRAILSIVEGRMKNFSPLVADWAKVKSVTGDECTVEYNDLEIKDILLGFDKSGVIVYPKVNSDVLILFTNTKKTAGAVIYCEKTDYVKIMGDANGGIGLTAKIAERLERIETAFENHQDTYNQHILLYNAHVHTGGTIMGSTGITTTDINLSTEIVNPKTNQAYISNDKIKHGNG